MADLALSARSLEILLGDWRGSGSAYESLAERIRLLIVDGRIAVDTRLPAERQSSLVLRLALLTPLPLLVTIFEPPLPVVWAAWFVWWPPGRWGVTR